MTPTITTPDQTARAYELIELWMQLDTEAQNESLARLVAAAVHPGHGSVLERFAGTGTLDAESALQEINCLRVPLERERSLTRFPGRVLCVDHAASAAGV